MDHAFIYLGHPDFATHARRFGHRRSLFSVRRPRRSAGVVAPRSSRSAGGHWAGEQEALGVVTAELFESLVLRGPLDALSDAEEFEHAC